jgi:hypothetical protein
MVLFWILYVMNPVSNMLLEDQLSLIGAAMDELQNL